MSVLEKFQRSWWLFKSSVQVILNHKRLLVFPVVIFVFTVLIALFFIVPVALPPTGFSYTDGAHWNAVAHGLFTHQTAQDAAEGAVPSGLTRAGIVYAVFLYFVSMFAATFFNVAFTNEILGALTGNGVSIRRGLRFARTRLVSILMWTLFAGLVGLVIRTIEEKLDWVGRLVAKFLGMAWSLACVFAIPVIVQAEPTTNPLVILRRSAQTLRKTWGEALIGYVGLQFGGALMVFSSIVLIIGTLVVSIMLENYWLLAVVGLAWLLALCAFAYLGSVASHVYRGALYLYAATGAIPSPYTKELLDMAWRLKKA
jgi:hypothetical protein